MKRAIRDSIPSSFDYIIVGAGATGCVLANRLSQNPNCRVLLIEAGSRDRASEIHQPGGLFSLWGSELDWQHSTEPQAGLGGRSILLSQGKVLGGSSSINAMIYTRGHRRDFDHWKRLGNEGWGYDEVLPYFLRSENFLGQPSQYHGIGGELTVQTCPTPRKLPRPLPNPAAPLAMAPIGISMVPNKSAAQVCIRLQ